MNNAQSNNTMNLTIALYHWPAILISQGPIVSQFGTDTGRQTTHSFCKRTSVLQLRVQGLGIEYLP